MITPSRRVSPLVVLVVAALVCATSAKGRAGDVSDERPTVNHPPVAPSPQRVRVRLASHRTLDQLGGCLSEERSSASVPHDSGTPRGTCSSTLPAPGSRLTGYLVRSSADGLVVRPEGRSATLYVPYVAMAKLEISRGERNRGSSATKGALAGGLLGVLFGVGSAMAGGSCSPDAIVCDGPGLALPLGIVAGAVGATPGLAAGAAAPTEQWVETGVPRPLPPVARAPTLGPGLRLILRF
jgi:hypothetical protein